jgi:hypothetical protein
MDRFRGCLRNAWQALLAVVVLGSLPVAADAAGMLFKNDTNQTIYVQGSSLLGGKIVRGPLLQIPPGKMMWDAPVPKGDRHIKITDGANRVLYDYVIRFDGVDACYTWMPVMQPKGPAKMELVPTKLPTGQ